MKRLKLKYVLIGILILLYLFRAHLGIQGIAGPNIVFWSTSNGMTVPINEAIQGKTEKHVGIALEFGSSHEEIYKKIKTTKRLTDNLNIRTIFGTSFISYKSY